METRVIVAHELRVQSPPTCPYGFVAELDSGAWLQPTRRRFESCRNFHSSGALEYFFIYKVMNMLALSRAQLWSLVQTVHESEIPLSMIVYWFKTYGKELPPNEAKELENIERRL